MPVQRVKSHASIKLADEIMSLSDQLDYVGLKGNIKTVAACISEDEKKIKEAFYWVRSHMKEDCASECIVLMVKVLAECGHMHTARQFAEEISVSYIYYKVQAFTWISRYSGTLEDTEKALLLISKINDDILLARCRRDARLSASEHHTNGSQDKYYADCVLLRRALTEMQSKHCPINSFAAYKRVMKHCISVSEKILDYK